jgi:hypothetical protein
MSKTHIAWLAFALWFVACADEGDDASVGPPGMEQLDAAALSDAAMPTDAAAMPTMDASRADAASMQPDAGVLDAMAPSDGAENDDAAQDAGPLGPNVDRTEQILYAFDFSADEADAEASQSLGTQLAELDTRVASLGKLVVYLHGAGEAAPDRCGSSAHGELLAGLGFHVFQPCYNSYYGVGNCGQDIGGCRLEAFEGVDHHAFIAIAPPDSIEHRIVRGLMHLQAINPEGDWQFFLDGDQPRWPQIIISGISHGASSSGVIGMHRLVHRVVMLSGPLDSDQAWQQAEPVTPRERFWGFSHSSDDQHTGHLAAFETLQLNGEATSVDGMAPPYGGSHRLITSAATSDGHGSTQAGGSSPQMAGEYLFAPVWRQLYVEP